MSLFLLWPPGSNVLSCCLAVPGVTVWDAARTGVFVAFKAAWVTPSTALGKESETKAAGASAACRAVGRAGASAAAARAGSVRPSLRAAGGQGSYSPSCCSAPCERGPAAAGDQSRAHAPPGWGVEQGSDQTVSSSGSSLTGIPVGKLLAIREETWKAGQ